MIKTTIERYSKRTGFTIVELSVIIVVIGILAAISIVGYGAWRNQLATNQVKNDLTAVSAAMEGARTFNDAGYPLALPTTFSSSPGVNMVYIDGTNKGYCIQASSARYPSVAYYVDTRSGTDKTPKSGSCSIQAPAISVATLSSTSTQVTVTTPTPNAASYTVERATNSGFTAATPNNFTGTSVVQTGLTPGTMYYYRVKANLAGASSGWSSTVTVTTPTPSWAYTMNTTSAMVSCSNSPTCAYMQIDYSYGAATTGTIPVGTTGVTFDEPVACFYTASIPSGCSAVTVSIAATNGIEVAYNDGTNGTFSSNKTITIAGRTASSGTRPGMLSIRVPSSVTASSATITFTYTPANTSTTGLYNNRITTMTLTKN